MNVSSSSNYFSANSLDGSKHALRNNASLQVPSILSMPELTPLAPTANSDIAQLQDNSVETSAGEGPAAPSEQLKQAFEDFVGQTFFSEMIKAMRSTQQKPSYFDGGRAEEIFQAQFDQTMAEELSNASAEKIAEPMLELFQLGRQR